jgi:hypothetical protein
MLIIGKVACQNSKTSFTSLFAKSTKNEQKSTFLGALDSQLDNDSNCLFVFSGYPMRQRIKNKNKALSISGTLNTRRFDERWTVLMAIG